MRRCKSLVGSWMASTNQIERLANGFKNSDHDDGCVIQGLSFQVQIALDFERPVLPIAHFDVHQW